MALALRHPTPEEVFDGMVGVLAADLGSADSVIAPIIPSTVPFDATTMDDTSRDPNALKYVKFGIRPWTEQGLSVQIIPMRVSDFKWIGAPHLLREELRFTIRMLWNDSDALQMTKDPHGLWVMLSRLSDALAVVLGPENLDNGNGYWFIGGDMAKGIQNPRCNVATPVSAGRFQSVMHLFAELQWQGRRQTVVRTQ